MYSKSAVALDADHDRIVTKDLTLCQSVNHKLGYNSIVLP